MRRAALALAVAGALAAAGCGDDEEPAPATVTVTQTQTEPAQTVTAPAPTATTASNRCPDVTITPNSGDGAFDITVENVTCEEAAELLRSSDGLRSWRCRVIAEGQGRRTTSCSQGDRVIVFATEA